MAANKRRQDEKHLKMLREMVTLAHNKQCFDCHQRGPTYVNMTIGSFVCTSCSGILRGLNPPHRVKSISMTSFTPEEMEFLKSRGNDFCRKVWLGLYDSRSFSDIDSKDESKAKDFMGQKYEKKRWYVAPTEAMHEEARKQNTPVAKTENKPQKSLGNNMPAIQATQLQNAKSVGGLPVQAVQRPHIGGGGGGGVNPSPVNAVTSPTSNQAPPPKSSSGLNLLDDLGGDPFAAPTGNVSNNSTSTPGDFANFANFNTMTTQQQPASTPQSAFPTQDFSGAGVMQPNSSSVATSASAGFANFSTASSSAATTPSGDKYAALADLDSVFGSSVFGGTSGSGGGSVFGGTATQVSAGNASVGWNGTSVTAAPSGGAPIPWGNMPPTSGAPPTGPGLPGGQAASSAQGFMPPASNPFGVQATSSMGNPFMSQAATSTAAGFGQFGQPPMPTASGFQAAVPSPYAGVTSTSTAAPHPHPGGAQFGAVQNGGWGYASAPQGPFPGAMPPTYAAATMQGYAAKPPQAGPPAGAQGYGQMPPQPHQGQFAGWPAQIPPAGNPFMAGVGQHPVPPRSNSTNPFL